MIVLPPPSTTACSFVQFPLPPRVPAFARETMRPGKKVS
jgi:hypothetical protein